MATSMGGAWPRVQIVQAWMGSACAFLLLMLAVPQANAAPRARDPSGWPLMAQGVVRALSDPAHLDLEDGATWRLAGVDPAMDSEAARMAFAKIAAALRGKAVRLHGHEAVVDRYGRPIGQVFAEDGTWVQAALLTAGATWVMPEPLGEAPWSNLLNLEAGARQRQVGLWSQLGTLNPRLAGTALGRFALIEGQILHVGVARHVIYLDFAGREARGFYAKLSPRALRAVVGRQGDAQSLQGQHVLIRGVIEGGERPYITLSERAQIQILDAAPLPAD